MGKERPTKKERQQLASAAKWFLKNRSGYAKALDQFGLDAYWGPTLRVLVDAHDSDIDIDIMNENPAWLYAMVWYDEGLVKLGHTLRGDRPRKGGALDGRRAEHVALVGREPDDEYIMAGSEELEKEFVASLGEANRVKGRKEWFHLTKSVRAALKKKLGLDLGGA